MATACAMLTAPSSPMLQLAASRWRREAARLKSCAWEKRIAYPEVEQEARRTHIRQALGTVVSNRIAQGRGGARTL